MKSKITLAVAAILLASGTAYAMQGMSCCQNCDCCNEKGGNHGDHKAPAPASQH
jgi:hypothetical protein